MYHALEQSGIALAFSCQESDLDSRISYVNRFSARSVGRRVKCCKVTKKKKTPLWL